MRNTFKRLLVCSVIAGVSLPYAVANAVTVSNNAAVTIVTPITLTANNNMNFGKVTRPATTGTVVLGSSGAISSLTGGITSVGGTPAAGTVNITGDSTQTVSVTVSNTSTVAGVSLSNFTGTFGGRTLASNTLTAATLTGGVDVMRLGATLTINSVAPGFTTGLKTPTYDVVVNYN